MSAIITQLDALFTLRREEIETWLAAKREQKGPFIYSSVDLRHSGVKIAPVDTNLFPAGFNNLSPAARHRAVGLFRDRFEAMNATKVLIVPENHTRNLYYLENLSVLAGLVEQSGREVKIGSLNATETLNLTSQSGQPVTELVMVRKGDMIETADGFRPDTILLNNDCTSGAPEILQGITQIIEPSYKLGWYRRRKSEHFRAYCQLAREFAETFGFDAWLIIPTFHRCGIVDFDAPGGTECITLGVEKVLHTLRRKYEEHGVTERPYVYVKADSGTYGMGIMTAESGADVAELNKKLRNKMNVIKEGTQNTEVIIQEGIPTIDRAEGAVAEPMMYLVDGIPVGGAYRVNDTRDALSNLNAPGMRFVGMCDEGECDEDSKGKIKVPDCNFNVFGLVATLAALAAAREVYAPLEIGFSI